jgi:hypothetical protein
MATIKGTSENGNGSFKQIEGEGWLSTYLPAISAGTVMTIVLFLAISCSRKSDNSATKIAPPEQAAVTNPAPALTAAATPAPAPAPKKVKRVRPANATYVNSAYGVSFSYPRKYTLEGNERTPLPLPASFVKPGAVEIASVEMPDGLYSDTDFSAALLNVSVHPGMTSEECAQFAPGSKDPELVKPETVKIGSNEFTNIEQMNGDDSHQADVKYFHLFKNGGCYEFALDVETSRQPNEDLAQVDRGQVFQQLSKILTTTRIKEVELPRMESAEKATKALPSTTNSVQTSPTVPLALSNQAATAGNSDTQKAQVVDPAQK